MDERPESVTVISWILLVFSAFDYLGCGLIWVMRDLPAMQQMMARYPISIMTMMWVSVAGVTICAICAVGFLKRIGWARHVYLGWAAAMLVYGYWNSPYPLLLIPNVVFTVVLLVLIYRPVANRWFAGKPAA